ncbi:histidine kinase [Mucilaginibacter phyllosphaerae]
MKKGWRIFCHILIWLGFIAFFASLARYSGKMTIHAVLVVFVLYGVINISAFYINYLVLIPRFLDKKKYKLYALWILATLIGFGLIKYGAGAFFKSEILMRTKGHETTFIKYFSNTLIITTIFLFLSAVLKFTNDWFLNERIQRDLENQRLSAELSFLKSQINPHFLFNSLNSIYSLAYQKSDTTPEAILKLSEIMRYMLYECNDNKVDLERELQYLHNYIDLQKIRFGDNAFINFDVTGEVTSQQIVPLLLISFIENAFKHGIANDASTPIILRIKVEDGHLFFFIQNKKHTHNRDSSGGIGLANVRRRLDLLYPGKYNLDIRDEADTYTCQLSLVL